MAAAATVPAKIVMKGTSTMSLHDRWSSLPAPVENGTVPMLAAGVGAGGEPSIVRPTTFDDVAPSMYADYEQLPAEYSLNGLSRPLDNRALARTMAFRPNVRAAFYDDLAYAQVSQRYPTTNRYSDRSPWTRLGVYRRPYTNVFKRRPYFYGGWRSGYYGAKRRGIGMRRSLYSDSMLGGGYGGRWRGGYGGYYRGRGGFRGRGRGWGFRGGRRQNAQRYTKEQLDKQLDEYMANTKTSLDAALDSYMNN